MVPPPPRRHAQVRREPAQALPGHLQRQLGLAGLEGPVGRASSTIVAPVGRRGVKVFRVDNPHTKPFAFWEWLIQRRPRARPRRDLPRRGVHQTVGHAPAREDRLHPVLHVLHLEELALGADRVRLRARAHRRERLLPPELLRQHAGHPARVPPARRPPGVRGSPGPRRHAEPDLRDLLGLRALRERPGARGLRGVPGLREVRDQAARARRPDAPADRAHQPHPARERRAPGPHQRHLPRHGQRRADRLRQAARGATP